MPNKKQYERLKSLREADPESAREFREKENASATLRWEKDPENMRLIIRRKRFKKWGWTIEKYDEDFKGQSGLCAICGDPPTVNAHNPYGRLEPDHAHTKPAKPRGLLCNKCNVAIGLFRDRPELCLAAAAYLREYQGE